MANPRKTKIKQPQSIKENQEEQAQSNPFPNQNSVLKARRVQDPLPNRNCNLSSQKNQRPFTKIKANRVNYQTARRIKKA